MEILWQGIVFPLLVVSIFSEDLLTCTLQESKAINDVAVDVTAARELQSFQPLDQSLSVWGGRFLGKQASAGLLSHFMMFYLLLFIVSGKIQGCDMSVGSWPPISGSILCILFWPFTQYFNKTFAAKCGGHCDLLFFNTKHVNKVLGLSFYLNFSK